MSVSKAALGNYGACEALQQAAQKLGLFLLVSYRPLAPFSAQNLNYLGCYGRLNIESLWQAILCSPATTVQRTALLAAHAGQKHRASPAGHAALHTRRSHGRLRQRPHDQRAEAEAVHSTRRRLRLSSLIDVRAGHDVLRVDHLRGPVLRSLRSGVGQTRPLLVGRPPIVLREVEHDAVRGRASPGRGINISFKYG